jgi:hypothetical protein
MSYANEFSDILARLQANWSTTSIATPNVPFNPGGSAYVRLNVLNTEAQRTEFSGGSEWVFFPGIIQVDIFVPEATGVFTAKSYADTIFGIFSRAEFSNIDCDVGEVVDVGTIEGYYQLSVSIPFTRREDQ